MTKRSRRVLLGGAVAVVLIAGLLIWYYATYSMAPAKAFTVNDPASPQRVLIATQGSEFKDAVVQGVVEKLKSRPIYIEVIDVSGLGAVDEKQWNAIVVMHTFQLSQPQPDAAAFVARAKGSGKVVVLGTSGEGTFKIEGVDALTSASRLVDVPRRVTDIVSRVDAMLSR
jgi:hypothetical protein